MSFIYVASPYASDDPVVTKKRVERVCEYMVYLADRGIAAYSPIVHNHQLVLAGARLTPDQWMMLDFALLRSAKELRVLLLDGWEYSVGVRQEIVFAERSNIPVSYTLGG